MTTTRPRHLSLVPCQPSDRLARVEAVAAAVTDRLYESVLGAADADLGSVAAGTGLGEIEFRREVGRRLRAERVRQGLSQHDLGAGAGLTRAAVGKIERGTHKVDVWRLHLLSRVLRVRVGLLLGEADR